jgi:Icc-related predicted phosphoesterase
MKVRVISDVHTETCEYGGVPDLGSADVLILGGDILCARHFKTNGKLHQVYKDFLQKCADNFKHVIYIQGNHEHWGLNYDNTYNTLKENIPPQIHLLENEVIKIENIVFLCCTLWTDFRNENPFEMINAQKFMNDYKSIRIGSNYRKFRPEDTLRLHKESKQFLIDNLEKYKDEKVWVVTHHAPSFQSVHPRYRMETINGSFVSDLEDLILSNPNISYFSHGHVHDSFDYYIGECRVICNPRGYFPTAINPNFDPNIEIEVS